jgi:hypothetical protein
MLLEDGMIAGQEAKPERKRTDLSGPLALLSRRDERSGWKWVREVMAQGSSSDGELHGLCYSTGSLRGSGKSLQIIHCAPDWLPAATIKSQGPC